MNIIVTILYLIDYVSTNYRFFSIGIIKNKNTYRWFWEVFPTLWIIFECLTYQPNKTLYLNRYHINHKNHYNFGATKLPYQTFWSITHTSKVQKQCFRYKIKIVILHVDTNNKHKHAEGKTYGIFLWVKYKL